MDGVKQVFFRRGLEQGSSRRPDTGQRGDGQSGSFGRALVGGQGFPVAKSGALEIHLQFDAGEAVNLLRQIKYGGTRIADHVRLAMAEFQGDSGSAPLGSRAGGYCERKEKKLSALHS